MIKLHYFNIVILGLGYWLHSLIGKVIVWITVLHEWNERVRWGVCNLQAHHEMPLNPTHRSVCFIQSATYYLSRPVIRVTVSSMKCSHCCNTMTLLSHCVGEVDWDCGLPAVAATRICYSLQFTINLKNLKLEDRLEFWVLDVPGWIEKLYDSHVT